MAWFLLFIAGLLEVAWAVGLKHSAGFSRPGPTVFTLVTLILSIGCLALAVRSLPLGTAYAVWTGIGAAGTAVIGMVWYSESRDPVRLGCLALILVGVIGLKLFSGRPSA